MNTNKITIIGTIIVIMLIVGSVTTYKVIKNHHKKLIQVTTDRIVDAAKKCYYEEKCTNKTVTLKELYDLNYISKQSNPISKEYYNEESYVKLDSFKFVVVE